MGRSIFIKTVGLLYLVVAMIGAMTAALLQKIFGFNIVTAIVIVLVAAIPVTAVVFALLMNGEKNSKAGRLHTEFLKELVNNGYSQRFLQISEEAVNAKLNGEKIGKVYLRDFVLYAADYYNLTRNYNKALSLIQNLSEFDFTGTSDKFIDQGLSAMMYYSALMDSYRGLGDKTSASNMIKRAAPILNREYKIATMNMGAEALYYNYCMLTEDYERAGEYAAKLASYNTPEADKYFVRFFIEAEYLMHQGKRDEAAAALKKMEPVIEKGGDLRKAMEFCYNQYWVLLGLKEQNQE